jgi:hypothetical protein
MQNQWLGRTETLFQMKGQRMKTRIFVLFLSLVACSATGFAQAVTPSITIGTHKLTLGMPEDIVLKQLGADLHLLQNQSGYWSVLRQKGQVIEAALGSVAFTDHRLSLATRTWEIDESSIKSLFYAIDAASKELEREGLTNCHISTTVKAFQAGETSTTSQEVEIDCGIKRVQISLDLADIHGTAPSANVGVTEILQAADDNRVGH